MRAVARGVVRARCAAVAGEPLGNEVGKDQRLHLRAESCEQRTNPADQLAGLFQHLGIEFAHRRPRAWLSAIAIACRRLLTRGPRLEPLCSCPCLNSCMTWRTFSAGDPDTGMAAS